MYNIKILPRLEYFGEQVAKFTVGYCPGESTLENRQQSLLWDTVHRRMFWRTGSKVYCRILSIGEYFGEQVAKFTVGYCPGESSLENRQQSLIKDTFIGENTLENRQQSLLQDSVKGRVLWRTGSKVYILQDTVQGRVVWRTGSKVYCRILFRGEYFGEQVAKFTVGYCSGESTLENRQQSLQQKSKL